MLLLKLCLTPLLIFAASRASRRWGDAVGGWIVGLPLTSGPVSLFLTLDQGPAFARAATAGSLAGTAAQACFGIAYFWAADHAGWPLAFAAGAGGFLLCAAVLQMLAPSHLALFVIALAVLTIGLRVTPRRAATRLAAQAPAWDIPARMVVATVLVLSVTGGAAALGPRLSGVIATFPIFAIVLTVFAHHRQGPAAARLVIRGLMLGLYGFACFFATLSLTLTRACPWPRPSARPVAWPCWSRACPSS
jgi:hypothetical protein